MALVSESDGLIAAPICNTTLSARDLRDMTTLSLQIIGHASVPRSDRRVARYRSCYRQQPIIWAIASLDDVKKTCLLITRSAPTALASANVPGHSRLVTTTTVNSLSVSL